MATPAAAWPGPDGVARRTHPLTLAAALVPMAGGVVFALVIAAASAGAPRSSSGSSGSPIGLLVFAGLALLTGAVQIVRWFATTYTVLPTELVIDEGVLSREHRVLPYARVQQADTHQNLMGQMLGLTELRVDSAGASGSTEIKLRLLDNATAVAVRDYVLQRRAELQHREAAGAVRRGGADPGAPPVGGAPVGADGLPLAGTAAATGVSGALDPAAAFARHEVPVLALGPARLVTGALTHSSLVVGIPIVLTVALWAGAVAVATSASRAAGAGLLAAVPVTLGVIAMLVVVHLINAVVGLYGFRVALAGDDIHLRYGLFETRNLTVPRRRVQQITIADNPLRRAFGLVELHLHTAAAPGEGKATTKFSIPVLRRSEVDGIVTTLMGDHTWAVPPITPRSAVALRRAMVRRSLVLAVAVSVPVVLLPVPGALLLLVALLGIPWGRAAHRRAGHGASATVVALTHGALHHRIDLVPLARVQSCRTYRAPLQRLNDLSTLFVDVAGSVMPPYLWDMDEAVATDLRRRLPRHSVT